MRYLALKPWGFTYKVEDLSKTGQDIRSGGTQIEYRDQDPEVHEIFCAECAKRGTERTDYEFISEAGRGWAGDTISIITASASAPQRIGRNTLPKPRDTTSWDLPKE